MVGSDTNCHYGPGNVCGRVQVAVSVAGTFFLQALPVSSTASGTYGAHSFNMGGEERVYRR